MASSYTAWGIEIGQYAIKAIQSSGRNTALIKAERDGNVRFIGLPLTPSKG